MCCKFCPFALTDESEYVQGLGCLPSPFDILEMKRKSGHNWACHSNEKKICSGLEEFIANESYNEKYKNLDTSSGGLISYETWYHEGEEEALNRDEQNKYSRGE